MLNATTLKTAAIVTIMTMLAANFTSGSSPMIRGGAMFGAAMSGLFFASKL